MDYSRTVENLRAASLRVRQGWCRGSLLLDGNVCAMGAIREVLGLDTVYHVCGSPFYWGSEAMAIVRALDLPVRVLESPGNAVATWNNAPEQTMENVAAGLEYAALVLEQQYALVEVPLG